MSASKDLQSGLKQTVLEQKLWTRIEPLAEEAGLEIFDIEATHAFLRIFITRKEMKNNTLTVDVADCSRLSRVILDLPDVEELLPGECQLEVSSPGVNRKLSKSKHFKDAIGERLRLVVKSEPDMNSSEGKKHIRREVLTGKLLSFDGTQLELEEELKKTRQFIDFNNVAEARVDFNFN